MFFGREKELSELERLYRSDSFQCLIMYGRRRVGKTTLISEFIKDKQAVFFAAQENTADAALLDFSDKVFKALQLDNFQGGFESWEKAFQFIGQQARHERLILVIDEFSYLARASKEIKSVLQNVIDHELQSTKLFLILCGSQVSFMEREVLGYNSPLYGRRTGQMKIEPFDFFESQAFFPGYSIEQQIEAYSILGGVPLYLWQFRDTSSIGENIRQYILKKYAYLYEEPRNLLKQELREPMNYNAVIEAIATGASTMNQISNRSKVTAEQCSRYLHTLEELLLVKREVPLGEAVTSRKGIYMLQDSFFRFWYAFVFPYQSELELDMGDAVWQEDIRPELPRFCGHAFEGICRQHFLRENKAQHLPYRFSRIGRWWGNNPVEKKQEEIDLYAVGKAGIYLGECKWRNEQLDEPVLANLQRRGQQLFGDKPITYVLYSKSGFTEGIKKIVAQRDDVLLYTLEDFKI